MTRWLPDLAGLFGLPRATGFLSTSRLAVPARTEPAYSIRTARTRTRRVAPLLCAPRHIP